MVEYTGASTFAEQLAAMAGTSVYISVHTSNLVNSLLLPPGAAVFEVLQRNWVWAGARPWGGRCWLGGQGARAPACAARSLCRPLPAPNPSHSHALALPASTHPSPAPDIDQFFRSLTAPLGDVHHYAWRAQRANETAFLNPELGRLFGNFTVRLEEADGGTGGARGLRSCLWRRCQRLEPHCRCAYFNSHTRPCC